MGRAECEGSVRNPFDMFEGHRFDMFPEPRNLGEAIRPLLGQGLDAETLARIRAHVKHFLGDGWQMDINVDGVTFWMLPIAPEDGA